MALEFSGPGVPLSALAFAEAAETLGVHAPEVWAVLTVETRGLGFLPDRRPLILFERHVFRRETGGRHDRTDPAVSDAEPGGYTEGPHEYDRLQQAVRLDRTAALRSASWGIGQVMGFNSTKAGYPTVDAMVADMTRSEDVQLKAMVGEIRSGNLDRFLRVHDWTSFARGYNGVNFARNQYDARLAAAHQRFAQGPLPDLTVRQGQPQQKDLVRHEALVAQSADEADFAAGRTAQVGSVPAALPQRFHVAAAHQAKTVVAVDHQIAKFHPAILLGPGDGCACVHSCGSWLHGNPSAENLLELFSTFG